MDVHVDEPPPPPSRRRPTTPTTAQPDRLVYTIREAAQALRISRTKLYELLDSGAIESVHIGRSRKIPADALRAYLDQLRDEQHRKADQ
jgi:excisionase family DNA binding protein